MPTGSFIPKFYFTGKPMPACIYVAWLIVGLTLTFYGGRTYIKFETNREQFLHTTIVLWHGRNEYWHPERGNFTENTWRIESESQHWVALAWTLQQHGYGWFANTKVLATDIIQCQDAEIEGSIFGIKSRSLFD